MVKKILVLIFFVCLLFATRICFAEADVTFLYTSGDVKVLDAGKGAVLNYEPGTIIEKGQKIVTGETGYAEISFDDANMNIVKIEGNSEVVVKGGKEEKLELLDGKILTVLGGLKKEEKFRIRTPVAVCGARGTAWGTITDGDTTDILVADGKVFVSGINPDGTLMKKEYWVKKGYERRIKKFEKPGKLSRMDDIELDKLEKSIKSPLRGKKPAPGIIKGTPVAGKPADGVLAQADPKFDRDAVADRKDLFTDQVEKRSQMRDGMIRKADQKDNLMRRIESRDSMDRIMNRQDAIEKRIDKRDAIEEQQRQDVIERKDLELLEKKDSTLYDGRR